MWRTYSPLREDDTISESREPAAWRARDRPFDS